ncbi:hypothetical protein [Rhodoblastus sp.]|uniref:hypothetical protein n=1 Tax=Rhodoblastus sp. TaxID=1962975 RepID=UPI0035ADC948
MPGVSSDKASDEDGKDEAPGIGHNGGPTLDQTGGQQSRDSNERDPDQKPGLSIVAPSSSSGSGDDGPSQQSGNSAQVASSRSIGDILSPNGEPVGYVYPRTDSRTRTVSPGQFDQLQAQLMDGAVPVAAQTGYDGAWYQRGDGSIFGVRSSRTHGPTIDVIKDSNGNLPRGLKVHQR